MTASRNITTGLAGALLAGALTACGGGSTALPPAPSPSLTSTASAPAWQAKYSPTQLAAYDAALARWKAYESAVDEILAGGSAAGGAESTYKAYTAIAPVMMAQLQSFQSQHLRLVTPAKTLWVRATRISGTADSLTLAECQDLASEVVTQNAKPLHPQLKSRYGLVTVDMSKPKGSDWLIYSTSSSTTPCTPTL